MVEFIIRVFLCLCRSALTYTLINHENVSEESIEELFKLWHINTMASS